MMKEKEMKRVPKLRFPEFTDDWEQRKLGDIIPVVTDYVAAGSFADIAANVDYKSEPDYAQLVRTVDLKHNFENNDSVYVDKNAFDYLYRVNLDEESIVLPNIGANIGEVYYIEPSELPYERNVLGPNAIYLKPNKNTKFIYSLFQTVDFQKKLAISVASSGQTSIIKTTDKDEETCKDLNSKVYSSVRGSALKAMGQLLWKNTTLFSEFKNIIEIVIKDENLIVKFAALCVIWPAYNIERDWAKEKIIYLYENDIRMVSFYDSKNMLLRLYPQYKKQVIDIVQRCFESEDEILIEIGGYTACEIYMLYTELEDIILACDSNSEKQMKAILDMAITYLKVDGYQEKAKNIILAYKNIDKDMNFPLSRIFYDNLVDATINHFAMQMKLFS